MVIAPDAVAALDLLILDASAKYHALMTGRLAVKVVVDGQETEFNKARASDLKGYLDGLLAQRDQLLGLGGPAIGAIGIVF